MTAITSNKGVFMSVFFWCFTLMTTEESEVARLVKKKLTENHQHK